MSKSACGGACTAYPDIVNSLILGNDHTAPDPYMVLADFEDYCRAHQEADRLFRDKDEWNRRAMINVANSSMFAADRSIEDYNEKIWHLKRVG